MSHQPSCHPQACACCANDDLSAIAAAVGEAPVHCLHSCRNSVDARNAWLPQYPTTMSAVGVVGVYAHWALQHYTTAGYLTTFGNVQPAANSRLCVAGNNGGSEYEHFTGIAYPGTDTGLTNASAYQTGNAYTNKRLGWIGTDCGTAYPYVCAIPQHAPSLACSPPPVASPPAPPPKPPAPSPPSPKPPAPQPPPRPPPVAPTVCKYC
jgi:hypothetical protein